jgi:hypothetical protein
MPQDLQIPPPPEAAPPTPATIRRRAPAFVLRAVIEIAFIIFLFYSNLLMGEFDRAAGQGKTFSAALYDILTLSNFKIAFVTALIGYLLFEQLRKRL